MEYIETRPTCELARYVECFWRAELATPGGTEVIRYILPDASMELLSIDGDVAVDGLESAVSLPSDRTVLVGQLRRPIRLRQRGRVSITGARLRPGSASAFFDTPMHRLADTIVPVNALSGGRLDRYLRDCSDPTSRMQMFEHWLGERLHRYAEDGVTRPAVNSILEDSGRTPVDSVARHVGVTPRHLERRFRDSVGLPPKLLSRIVRFSRAVERIKSSRRICWSAIAFDAGYADQAHFIRDFRQFSGHTPGRVGGPAIDSFWCSSLDSSRESSVMSHLFNTPRARCA